MCAYYNEFDPVAAQWLRNLIEAGLIAPGVVDDRSIEDVTPADLMGFAQVHLFAGIGGWSLALRRAGWPDDRSCWTGSCPCQPFSQAGEGVGFDDERHLWPAMFWPIRILKPGVIFGEQASSKIALAWLDLVQADLEGEGYTVGAVDTCAASVGAPHIRQRLYWVAGSGCSNGARGSLLRPGRPDAKAGAGESTTPGIGGASGGMGNPEGDDQRRSSEPKSDGQGIEARGSSGSCGLDYPSDPSRRNNQGQHGSGSPLLAARPEQPGPTNGFWRDAEWLPCRDGKARPTKPGTPCLATGIPGRVAALRAFGNALCIEQAAAFIDAYREISG